MDDNTDSVPCLNQAIAMMKDAEKNNPGPWILHSLNTAVAAREIAKKLTILDPDTSYILGYLHDIGRREGITDMRHTLDGYNYLYNLGFTLAAKICITHSFPILDGYETIGNWDCTIDELSLLRNILSNVSFTQYDRLIQLCDVLALSDGFCLMEKRIIDIALRHGINKYSVLRWKELFRIKNEFENEIGKSIYYYLPGVINNTFGFT